MAFNWTCPYCARAQTVTEKRFAINTTFVGVSDLAEGSLVYQRESIGCSNPDCKRLTFTLTIGQGDTSPGYLTLKKGTELFGEQLLPRGTAKPQPDYIPAPIVEDYTEACLIRDLSPKASATLTRRCLQGMIRDFAKISKKRLIDEINSLKETVEDGTADRAVAHETVAAIDHVRSIGNIGAHMEADIDVIVPVDAGEAQAMINLIEMLFDEWYGARHRRNQRLVEIEKIKLAKDGLKEAARTKVVPALPVAGTETKTNDSAPAGVR